MQHCYTSIRQKNTGKALPAAISHLCAASHKIPDAPCSAVAHIHEAIVHLVACLPGWTPDDFQKEEVDAAIQSFLLQQPPLHSED